MGVFDQFLNTTDEAAGFSIVDVANPVQWGALAQAIVSSIVAAAAVGVTNIYGSVATAFELVFGGVVEFLTGSETTAGPGSPVDVVSTGGLLDVTVGRLALAAEGFWQFNVEQFGVFGGPVTVAITLLVLYVVTLGGRAALDEFRGGA